MKQYEEKNAPKLNHDITLEEIEAACRAHQKENDNRNMAEECRAIAREQKEKMQAQFTKGKGEKRHGGAAAPARQTLPHPARPRCRHPGHAAAPTRLRQRAGHPAAKNQRRTLCLRSGRAGGAGALRAANKTCLVLL